MTRRAEHRLRAYDRWTAAGLVAGSLTFVLLTATALLLIAMRPKSPAAIAGGGRVHAVAAVRVAAAPPAAFVTEPVAPPPPVVRASLFVPPPPLDIPPLRVFDERAAYRWLIRDAASRRSLSPKLIEAILRVESDFNPREVSNKGALGIMQVIPSTGARFGVRRHELFDPARNIAAGTAYLAWLRDRYRGDLDRMLAAYNAGEGAVDRYDGVPPYRETQDYVRRVRAELAMLR